MSGTFLLRKPSKDVERKSSAAVEHDDARREVRTGLEEAVSLLLLRVVGEAVPNY